MKPQVEGKANFIMGSTYRAALGDTSTNIFNSIFFKLLYCKFTVRLHLQSQKE